MRPLLLTLLSMLSGGCCTKPLRAQDTTLHCRPQCERMRSCKSLDERLLAARRPLLACVARAGAKSDLASTHRCHRALRLIENARWLLRTVQADGDFTLPVYNAPLSRRSFFCHVEHLAAAPTAQAVEQRYLALVRAYP
ncbi:MAG: hypothetical protein JRH20_09120 [Deltaproteobacteria bacterium]|nr:hypothetical protein [Deltaproteobacteria bacterium]